MLVSDSGVSRQDIQSAIRGTLPEIIQPITDPVLGSAQTTPIASPPEPNALQAAGGGGPIAVTVTNIGEIGSALSNTGGAPSANITVTLEVDGDKMAEVVENNVVTRRGEGRSLLNG